MDELCESKPIERGQTYFNKTHLPNGQLLIDICEGLVTQVPDGVVQFAHFTVREYLKSHYENRLLSHADIEWTCLTCVAFKEFDELYPNEDLSFILWLGMDL